MYFRFTICNQHLEGSDARNESRLRASNERSLGTKNLTSSGLAKPVDEAHLERLFSGDDPAGHDEVEGPRKSDELGQPDGTSVEKGNPEAAIEDAQLLNENVVHPIQMAQCYLVVMTKAQLRPVRLAHVNFPF